MSHTRAPTTTTTGPEAPDADAALPPVALQVGAELRRRGLTLATAESCTGGLISSWLTAVAGSSDYYRGGVVAYANEVKSALLDVPRRTLHRSGAVSEETALRMADGARRRLGSDLAVSVTGIAGPGGGTPHKPVGLVYVGLASPDGVRAVRHQLHGTRGNIRWSAAAAALQLVLDALAGTPAATEHARDIAPAGDQAVGDATDAGAG